MSCIITPFMKSVVEHLEAEDVIACTYVSRFDRLVIDSPDVDDRKRWGSECRSFGLPLEVLEGAVRASFRFIVEAGLQVGHRWEPLTGNLGGSQSARIHEALAPRGYTAQLDDVSSENGGAVSVTFATVKYTLLTPRPEAAVAEVQWLLEHAREFWPNESWVT